HHRALLRYGERLVEREQEHGGPQANRARAAGYGGQPDERCRIERSIVVVLAEPHRVESRHFGALALTDGLLEIAPRLKRTQAELHVVCPPLVADRHRPRVPGCRAFADVLSNRDGPADPRRVTGRARNLCAIARYCTITGPMRCGIGCAQRT